MCGLLHCPAVEMIIHHHHGSSHNLYTESASSFDPPPPFKLKTVIFTSSLLTHTSPNNSRLQEIWFSIALNFALLSLSLLCSVTRFDKQHTIRMVSYKRLNPEDVQFSSAVLSEEPRPVREDVPVSSWCVFIYHLYALLPPLYTVRLRSVKDLVSWIISAEMSCLLVLLFYYLIV